MTSNLNTYANLQYNPISIPDYCVVEVYKDEIVKPNGLGYFILPIGGLTDNEIEQKIKDKVDAVDGYTNLAILAGKNKKMYKNRIVYAVWYNDVVPAYPNEPYVEPIEAGKPFNPYQKIEIINEGTAASALVLEFDCLSFDEPIEFKINEKKFKIWVDNPVSDISLVYASNKGVQYNKKLIDSFIFPSVPKLKSGINIIEVKGTNVKNLKIDYVPRY